MARISQMQGVPSHLEFLKSTDKKRRHPAHCIFAYDKGANRKCKSPHSAKYNEHCNSAAKCDYYEEQS